MNSTTKHDDRSRLAFTCQTWPSQTFFYKQVSSRVFMSMKYKNLSSSFPIYFLSAIETNLVWNIHFSYDLNEIFFLENVLGSTYHVINNNIHLKIEENHFYLFISYYPLLLLLSFKTQKFIQFPNSKIFLYPCHDTFYL